MSVTTKIEKSLDALKRAITTTTIEKLDATTIDEIEIPGKDSLVRNVKRSLSEGRAVLTFDRIDATVGDNYTISGTASQEPLATHPYFQPGGKWEVSAAEWKVWDKWNKDGTDISGETLTGYSTGFQKFISLYLAGFTDYLSPAVTIRVVDSASPAAPDVSGLGTIQEPEFAPTVPTGVNWLLVSVDGNQNADGDWDVTKEYRSSGPNGWNADIYGA